MPVEVIGLDHVFVTMRGLSRSRSFHDRVMLILGFRQGEGNLGGAPRVFYHNRQLVYPPGSTSAAVAPAIRRNLMVRSPMCTRQRK